MNITVKGGRGLHQALWSVASDWRTSGTKVGGRLDSTAIARIAVPCVDLRLPYGRYVVDNPIRLRDPLD